jgi:hypothetical protein
MIILERSVTPLPALARLGEGLLDDPDGFLGGRNVTRTPPHASSLPSGNKERTPLDAQMVNGITFSIAAIVARQFFRRPAATAFGIRRAVGVKAVA